MQTSVDAQSGFSKDSTTLEMPTAGIIEDIDSLSWDDISDALDTADMNSDSNTLEMPHLFADVPMNLAMSLA